MQIEKWKDARGRLDGTNETTNSECVWLAESLPTSEMLTGASILSVRLNTLLKVPKFIERIIYTTKQIFCGGESPTWDSPRGLIKRSSEFLRFFGDHTQIFFRLQVTYNELCTLLGQHLPFLSPFTEKTFQQGNSNGSGPNEQLNLLRKFLK